MEISGLTLNWFDLVVLVTLAVGIFRGRKRGISEELLDVIKWVTIVLAGGFLYRPLGVPLADSLHVQPVMAFVIVYVSILIIISLLFNWIKKMAGEKLVSSDAFGSWEYYLGMLAGATRFSCYLIAAMAILHAYCVSADQLAANAKMQKDNFGDISFPTLGTMQQAVFVRSAAGPIVLKYLEHALIVTSASETTVAKAETLGRQRESSVYEALGEKK